MKKLIPILALSLLSGCAYTCVQTPQWSMYRISLLWKTEGEINMTTNGTVTAKGTSGDDSETVKAAVGAAVQAAVQAVKP